jgi:hypothetical protein
MGGVIACAVLTIIIVYVGAVFERDMTDPLGIGGGLSPQNGLL